MTISGLFDLDGDSHVDRLTFEGGSTLQTYKLLSAAAGVEGALDVGRIVSTSNGYGGMYIYKYDNAKRHTEVSHRCRTPRWCSPARRPALPSGAEEPQLDPRYFRRYGDPQRVFDWASNRWSFRGYGRTISVTGRSRNGTNPAPGPGSLPPATIGSSA